MKKKSGFAKPEIITDEMRKDSQKDYINILERKILNLKSEIKGLEDRKQNIDNEIKIVYQSKINKIIRKEFEIKEIKKELDKRSNKYREEYHKLKNLYNSMEIEKKEFNHEYSKKFSRLTEQIGIYESKKQEYEENIKDYNSAVILFKKDLEVFVKEKNKIKFENELIENKLRDIENEKVWLKNKEETLNLNQSITDKLKKELEEKNQMLDKQLDEINKYKEKFIKKEQEYEEKNQKLIADKLEVYNKKEENEKFFADLKDRENAVRVMEKKTKIESKEASERLENVKKLEKKILNGGK
jgi:chromosome segregation ATPase